MKYQHKNKDYNKVDDDWFWSTKSIYILFDLHHTPYNTDTFIIHSTLPYTHRPIAK